MQWLSAGLDPCGKSCRQSSAATLFVEIVRMVQGALIDPTPARLFETWLVRMPRGLSVDYRVVGAILLGPSVLYLRNPAEHSEHVPSCDPNLVHIRASRAVPFESQTDSVEHRLRRYYGLGTENAVMAAPLPRCRLSGAVGIRTNASTSFGSTGLCRMGSEG
jgi:hypothetical protein